jgi:hypothetical protein
MFGNLGAFVHGNMFAELLSGGHRKGTHSLLGVALLTAAALWAGSGLILALLFSAGFRALYIGGHHADLFGIAVAALVIWQGWDGSYHDGGLVPVLSADGQTRHGLLVNDPEHFGWISGGKLVPLPVKASAGLLAIGW